MSLSSLTPGQAIVEDQLRLVVPSAERSGDTGTITRLDYADNVVLIDVRAGGPGRRVVRRVRTWVDGDCERPTGANPEGELRVPRRRDSW